MARKSTVWFRQHDGFYYTTIRGEQIKLSQDKTEAEREFHRRMAELPDAIPRNEAHITLAMLVKAFLEDSYKNNAPDTYRGHKRFLLAFARNVGKVIIPGLKPYMAYRWVALHEQWGPSTRRVALNTVQACLNWSVKQGYIKDHPLKHLDKPPASSRDTFVTPEQQEKIFTHLRQSDPFRDFLFAMVHSGCRPGEVSAVQAEGFDAEVGVWVIENHKNRKKTGKPRIVYLTPELVELSKRLYKECDGSGPLFRNRDNRSWKKSSISYRMRKLAEELNIPGLSAYLVRHAYITLALEKGMSDSILAELCGNSPRTIKKHYSHLSSRVQSMREAARRAVG